MVATVLPERRSSSSQIDRPVLTGRDVKSAIV
jgi:hypothetical protein